MKCMWYMVMLMTMLIMPLSRTSNLPQGLT